jgi:hypothetical protein
MAAKRMCAKCGRERDIQGGKVCEKGHFVCKECVKPSGFFASELKKCPLCQTKIL